MLSDQQYSEYLTNLNRVRGDADRFHEFLKENKWFPDEMDNEYKLKTNFSSTVLENLKTLEEGAMRRPEAIQNNSPYLEIDDKWSLKTLAEVEQYLQKLRRKFNQIG